MMEAVEVAVARMDRLSQHWSHPFRGGVDASSVKLCHDLPHIGSKFRQSCFVLLRAVGSIAIGCGPIGLRAQARQRSAGATESASCRGSREWRHHGFASKASTFCRNCTVSGTVGANGCLLRGRAGGIRRVVVGRPAVSPVSKSTSETPR